MKTIIPFTIVALCLFCVSCTNEDIIEVANINESEEFVSVGKPVEVKLTLSSQNFTVDATTRAEEPMEEYYETGEHELEVLESEKNISNFWVFEYDAESEYLIFTPQYLTSDDFAQDETTKAVTASVTLGDNNGKPVIIYVVANVDAGTSSSNAEKWAQKVNKTFEGFKTIEELEHNTLPTTYSNLTIWTNVNNTVSSSTLKNNLSGKVYPPYAIFYTENDEQVYSVAADYVPKSGSAKIETIEENTSIKIDVESMYAKIMVYFDFNNSSFKNQAIYYQLIAQNIPGYCRVRALADAETTNGYDYPSDMNFYTFADPYYSSTTTNGSYLPSRFHANGVSPDLVSVIYIPENIQGETGETNTSKADNIPATAYNKSSGNPQINANRWQISSWTWVDYPAQTDAFVVQLRYSDGYASTLHYGFYPVFPGGNSTTNFNVRRNCTYIVTFKVEE